MVAASVSLESLCVNSIRMLAVDAVNKSNSGHPGLPMGCAPMGYALWQNVLNHNPNNPKWFNRALFLIVPMPSIWSNKDLEIPFFLLAL